MGTGKYSWWFKFTRWDDSYWNSRWCGCPFDFSFLQAGQSRLPRLPAKSRSDCRCYHSYRLSPWTWANQPFKEAKENRRGGGKGSRHLGLSVGTSFSNAVPMKDFLLGNIGTQSNALVTRLGRWRRPDDSGSGMAGGGELLY